MAVVVLVGGGMGGLSTAIALRKGLSKDHRVIVVEPQTTQYFLPSLLWVMVGRRAPGDITRSIDPVSSRGIILQRGEAVDIDLKRRNVKMKDGELPYDFLVLAPGAEFATELIPGLRDRKSHAPGGDNGSEFNLYTMDGVIDLTKALRTFGGGEIAIVAPPGQWKCPPVPYEAAMLLDGYFRKAHKNRNVRISVYTPESSPFEAAGSLVGKAIGQNLEKRGIKCEGNRHLTAVERKRKLIRFRDGVAPYDLLIFIPPHRAPEITRRCGLSREGGYVRVDPHSMATQYDGVYVIGDAAEVQLPSGLPLPKMGAITHLQSLVVAGNIVRRIEGKGKVRSFSGIIPCFIELGGGTSIAIFGNLYKPGPQFRVFPSFPLWVAAKALAERNWLRERE
ncbi:MAG TPA: NAD(P)/FAD-dependent oxidoreductase [Firmicutes bacterium]|nr:NAD(P)/FAD-dependent oxidoreductase [Bacillota bacterium]